ncbi:MAG: lipoprotein NlpI [Methanoregulaceae archaeon PtaU1.Bin059]|nr:MAG: lipoprotein NlpI [Methanoregulaceae archaeon PtaB.Bin056]OPY42746.1 MAG: lipoprotein NlpI [Methanoregulaceae archaeon PtaU1.Bin059]
MRYMAHQHGDVLLRHEEGTMTYEVYHGYGRWVPDPGGFGTWSGMASNADWYDEVSEEKAQVLMREIDRIWDAMRARAPAHDGSTPAHGVDTTSMYNQGSSRLRDRNYRGAVEILQQVVEADPSFADAWHNLGVGYAYLGRYDDAIACYDRVLKLLPDDALALTNRGIILIRKNEFETAVPFIRDALKKNPRELPLRVSFINLLTALGRYEEAIQCRDEMPPVGGMTYMLLSSLSSEYRDMSGRIHRGEPVEKVKAALHGNARYEKPEDVKLISLSIKGPH